MLRIDPAAELATVKQLLVICRRRRYRRSRLDRFRAELVAMRMAGASLRELAYWLRHLHRCKVNKSTIFRYLRKLPELNRGGA